MDLSIRLRPKAALCSLWLNWLFRHPKKYSHKEYEEHKDPEGANVIF
jgi:hypothetical protein